MVLRLFLQFLKFVGALIVAAVFIGVGIASTYGTKWARELPDFRQLDTLSLGAITRVYARDNSPLGTLVPKVGDQKVSRTLVKLDEISPFMTAALITNEDRRFFQHYGLDPYGIARQFRRLSQKEDVQGGSTLTNQLVRNTLLLKEYQLARTPDRKIKEWMLSVLVERAFTKEEILQDYLNAIYWGDGGPVELYGIYSASQAYFGKAPRDLDLAQSVYLTTLVPSPRGRYNNYPNQRGYMRSLLTRMVQDGWVTQEQANAAWKEKLVPRGWQVAYDDQGKLTSSKLVDKTAVYQKAVTTVRYPDFVQQVEQELVARLGRDKVYGSGGLRVYTTIDPRIQAAVEKASLNAQIPPRTTLAAVISDPFNGDVLGMIGQKLRPGVTPPEWNNAAQGQRQIGSTIKPLLYTTALSTDKFTQLTTRDDKPISFPCPSCKGGFYAPKDFEGEMTFRNMTLREALDRSLNLPTVRIADDVGLPTFFGKLKELGIPPNDGTGLAAALGAVETTPVKMAAAYAPFANGGLYHPPRYITRVTTARGEVLYDVVNEVERPKRVWSPQVAYLGLDMIQGVVNDLTTSQGGFSEPARIPGWPVGGKTGTSNGPKDLWFVGVNPYYVGAVWIGIQQGGNMATNIYSGVWAPPIWHNMMVSALAGKTARDFGPPPPGIYKTALPPIGPLQTVQVAMLDPRFRDAANGVPEQIPARPQYQEVGLGSSDPSTTVIYVDITTGRLATEFTKPANIAPRRIYTSQIASYASDGDVTPLPDETADPAAVKAFHQSNGNLPITTPPAPPTPPKPGS
ncbi:transglycosylase domain-containing protein [Deinococcus psychrotolerans]|uniref:transglycosylase domain-containing protein n=1 Tax=Deinococcus psychrotolerans TaxID=2489213 RepID=UPI001F14F732|nr:transglycosylase domain-containing protein [Deinococcus psychrotolerans]